MRFEKSCGAVIYRESAGTIEFLAIRSKKFGHWGIPKGHVEEGESEQETAKREVLEETGLDIMISSGFRKIIEYSPSEDTCKAVVYFIGKVSRETVKIQEEEVQDYRWLDYSEMLELLTFDSDRKVVAEAKNFLS
jgi:bis(5'-nucleosidyl)-tetraphosphatase